MRRNLDLSAASRRCLSRLAGATVTEVRRLHHVNLTIPVGGENDEAAFLVNVLGYQPIPAPDDLPFAKWFEFPDGSQIHLSEDPDHHPSARGHVAIELGPDLEVVAERLDAAGYEVSRFDGPDLRVIFCADPAGNRWELRHPVG
jgi:catechol 2,3-dioxygenase-like lactoylglutathione lyase family enzyme